MRKRSKYTLLSFFIIFAIFLSINKLDTQAASGGYSIVVNVTQNVVTIYQGGQPIKTMICSTGTYTPRSGTYKTSDKYRWHTLVGNVYGQYCTRITGSILFHSVPYTQNGNPASVEYWEYDKLGTSASLGCVRLCVEDAKWIYDNCPRATSVTFVTGNSMPLGKPTAYKISSSPSMFRGWDPTDPAGENPWNIIKNKNCFSSTYYSDKYGDLKKAFGNDSKKLAVHWINNGINERRQSSEEFDLNYYKNTYKDLQNAFGNNNYAYVTHYINHGKSEGRIAVDPAKTTVYNGIDYSSVYNFQYYISKYPDINKVYGRNPVGALKHFVNYGMKEGRQASANFNVKYYKNRYVDLRNAYGNDLQKYYIHYIKYGKKEGRNAKTAGTLRGRVTKLNGVDYSAVYDFNYYINHNPDVYRAFGMDDIAVLNHFVNCGMKEGRIAKSSFNVRTYKNRYADLQKAFGNDYKKYFMHYINYGIKEKRKGN